MEALPSTIQELLKNNIKQNMTCEEIKQKWSELPIIVKVIPPFALAAFLCTLLGFAVPLWTSAPINITFHAVTSNKQVVVQMDHIGLWQVCGNPHGCVAIHKDLPGWMIATRVFMTFALIGSFIITTMIFLLFAFEKVERNIKFQRILTIYTITNAFFEILAIIIWAFQVTLERQLSFAYFMAAFGGIFYVATGMSLLVYFRKVAK